MKLTLHSRVQQSDTIMTGEENGQTVMMDIVNGGYIQLEGTGAFIWEQIATEKSVSDVCDALLASYEIDEATCTATCLEFLTDLAEGGAVTIIAE